MIYDRHEDLAATTKRHPAVIRYRTGVRRDGTIVAQDIDVVMDGGAYCTLTPVVLSAGRSRRRPVRRRERPNPIPAVATNTPPNGAFRGFGAPQTEFARRDAGLPRRRGDRMSPLELRAATPTGRAT